jgi:hypothetical protein
MALQRKPVEFSLKDVGANVIDQISTDIYTGPGSILRELVKNAYDAYLLLTDDDLEENGFLRQIVISRERVSPAKRDKKPKRAVGTLTIADTGIGQDLDDLKANVQISITRKPADIDHATGFRGLGSWSTLGAGSKIVITSTKKGVGKRYRLTINVRRVYAKMTALTTLDDILNDSACIWFEEDDAQVDKSKHETVVEITCDGPPEKVNGHELNRLYEYTDPTNDKLRALLVEYCPVPFSAGGGAHKEVQKIYTQTGYVATSLVLDGDEIQRQLPPELTQISTEQLKVGGKIAAYAWYAENPDITGAISKIDEAKHALHGPGIQLVRLNVPIGPKNVFSDDAVRARILNWFVGEVHIVLPDVLPNASGQELRAGTARDAFIQELHAFYSRLEDAAEEKSVRVSLKRRIKKGLEAASRTGRTLSRAERALADADIAKSVQALEDARSRRKPKNIAEERFRRATRDPDVAKILKEARSAFKAKGLLREFASSPARQPLASGPSLATPATAAPKSPRIINLDEFQARLGSAAPRLEEAGLTRQQIQEVFKIISDLVVNQ